MIKLQIVFLLGLSVVGCGEEKPVLQGKDVTQEFLEAMEGTYKARPNLPREDPRIDKPGSADEEDSSKAVDDFLTITVQTDSKTEIRQGSYTMAQYWYLEYPVETCRLVGNQSRCEITFEETYCRMVDSGKISRVIKLPGKRLTGAVTHRIEGLSNPAEYDADHPFEVDSEKSAGLEPKHVIDLEESVNACKDMVQKKNQSLSAKTSSYRIVWPNNNTLKFTHETVPEKPGLQRLDDAGTFTRE